MRPSVVPMWATVTLSRCVTYSAVTCTGPNSPLNRSTRERLLLTSRGKWRQLLLGLGASRPGWGDQGRSQGSSPHTDPLRPLSVTIAAQTPTPHLACVEKAPGLPVTAPPHGALRGDKAREEGPGWKARLPLHLVLPLLPCPS